MSHAQQTAFVSSVRERFPEAFYRKRVLEIGSYFVNGSVRDLFTDCEYVGVDVAEGACVDLVCHEGYAVWAREHQEPAQFDTVISCETLEHDSSWQDTLHQMWKALKPGGPMILTCAGRARQEHGTRRTSPQDSLLLTDYYRGLDEEDLRTVLLPDMFTLYEFSRCVSPSDSYFCGAKR